MIVWSGHNFAHATTAELSWHVQICDLIVSKELELEKKLFRQNFSYELISDMSNGPQGSKPGSLTR